MYLVSNVKLGDEMNAATIDHDFSLVREVHGDCAANVGLDLSDAPVRPVRMPDQHAWFEE